MLKNKYIPKMKILIGIATYKRPEKLKRLLRSIENQNYKNFDVAIAFDNGDIESISALGEWNIPLFLCVMPKQSYVIGCWNKLHQLKGYDAHLMLCDDVELFPDCLENAVKELEEKFPDLDGVIGITQECPGRLDYTYKPFGQTLMGRKFIDRYKEVNYQVCCPYYVHFSQDCEMWQFMSELGKTYHSDKARLYHYHPAFKPEEIDATHAIVRVPTIFQKDIETFKKRQAEGKLWGRSFEK
jgi:hypothetical protein